MSAGEVQGFGLVSPKPESTGEWGEYAEALAEATAAEHQREDALRDRALVLAIDASGSHGTPKSIARKAAEFYRFLSGDANE